VAFRQINRSTSNRVRQQLIDDVTREPIEAGEKARGFEVGKNQYLLMEDDELDAVTIESNHTIEIDSFVPREQMDERYLDSPYISFRTSLSARKPSPSFAMPCSARTWLHLAGSC
jgi:DNA end-binding protein Ku